jgi:hypothetical protein
MEKKLTTLQAFNAMRKFLEGYYERTSSDDVGSLLGDMQMFHDGETFDPAAWDDWTNAVEDVLQGRGPKPTVVAKE